MIVFVHGVPETAVIWDAVRAAIGRPSEAVQLPGFGCPHPDGFEPTKDAYAEWLAAELARIGGGEPVDLVGHDWGAGLTLRMATAHAEALRSWVMDVGNIAHPDYVWHDIAQVWQTPEQGEQFIAAQNAMSVEDRAALFVGAGVPEADALGMSAASDDVMGASILGLYRSATPRVHADWGPYEPSRAPGLVMHSAGDPYSDEAQAAEVAASLGADFAVLDGAGHFWPYEAPDAGAALLTSFWDGLDR